MRFKFKSKLIVAGVLVLAFKAQAQDSDAKSRGIEGEQPVAEGRMTYEIFKSAVKQAALATDISTPSSRLLRTAFNILDRDNGWYPTIEEAKVETDIQAGIISCAVESMQAIETVACRSDMETAKVKVAKFEGELSICKGQLGEVKHQKAGVEAALASVTAERDAGNAKIEEVRAALLSTKDKLKGIETKNADLESTLASVTTERDAGKAEIAEVRAAQLSTEGKLKEVEAKSAEFEAALASVSSERDARKAEIDDLKVALASVTAERDAGKIETAGFRAALHDTQEKLKGMEAQNTELHAALLLSSKKSKLMFKRDSELRKASENFERELKSVQSQEPKRKRELRQAQGELEDCTHNLDECQLSKEVIMQTMNKDEEQKGSVAEAWDLYIECREQRAELHKESLHYVPSPCIA